MDFGGTSAARTVMNAVTRARLVNMPKQHLMRSARPHHRKSRRDSKVWADDIGALQAHTPA
jgi:hypothetical protein